MVIDFRYSEVTLWVSSGLTEIDPQNVYSVCNCVMRRLFVGDKKHFKMEVFVSYTLVLIAFKNR